MDTHAAQLIDEMHLVYSPVLLGTGESLLDGLNLPALGYEVSEKTFSEVALHVIMKKRS